MAQRDAGRIPREDLVSFVAAVAGSGDLCVLRNRELLQGAVERQASFECMTPEDSVARLEASVG